MSQTVPSLLPTIFGLTALSMLPFLAVMTTAFTKISIVLLLLRNALGVQQAPSTLVLNSIALTLTIFISMPLAYQIAIDLNIAQARFETWPDIQKSYEIISKHLIGYLTKFSFERERLFFMQAARELWPPELHQFISPTNLLILIPSHVVSEITRAFEIGFLLFLPFIVIDMVVSNILLAMGAMMVPPMLLSLPAKLLLFIAADGWTRLLHGLIISYI